MDKEEKGRPPGSRRGGVSGRGEMGMGVGGKRCRCLSCIVADDRVDRAVQFVPAQGDWTRSGGVATNVGDQLGRGALVVRCA